MLALASLILALRSRLPISAIRLCFTAASENGLAGSIRAELLQRGAHARAVHQKTTPGRGP